VIPTNGELYAEAEVVAVGPGNGTVAGGRSETFDLKVGQRVFLQHKRQGQSGRVITEMRASATTVEGKTYFLYEQTSILGIVAEPGEWFEGGDPPEQPKWSSSSVN
jgi:co-chaperonin GroES (HSP10)